MGACLDEVSKIPRRRDRYTSLPSPPPPTRFPLCPSVIFVLLAPLASFSGVFAVHLDTIQRKHDDIVRSPLLRPNMQHIIDESCGQSLAICPCSYTYNLKTLTVMLGMIDGKRSRASAVPGVGALRKSGSTSHHSAEQDSGGLLQCAATRTPQHRVLNFWNTYCGNISCILEV